MNRNDELEAFKALNLTQIAAAHGYAVVGKVSSMASSVVMAHANGDKIVVAKSRADEHWIYFSVRDQADCGTVIDFLQNRGIGSLGDVRKELRPWLDGGGGSQFDARSSAYVADLQPIERDIAGIRARFETLHQVGELGHKYLCDERAIPADLLAHPRFAGKIYTDERGNAVFPHHDRGGLCGLELKNRNFTGFSKGGIKGLWCSAARIQDQKLVFAETGIDGLSYAALHGCERSRFSSLAGQVSPEQMDLVQEAVKKLHTATMVVLAFDNDDAGDKLTDKFAAAVGELGVKVESHRPKTRTQDWNDVLRGNLPTRRQTHPNDGTSLG